MFFDAIKQLLKSIFIKGDGQVGGERETKVASKSSKPGKAGKGDMVGHIRIHENKGEVHFHDDDKGHKVAVPVDRWFAIWEQLRTDLGHRCFYDTKTNCMLQVHVDSDFAASEINVDMTIEKLKQTTPFSNLDKFTNG